MRILKAALTFGLVLAFAAPVLAGTEYQVVGIGLTSPSTWYTNGYGINNAGTVVGSAGTAWPGPSLGRGSGPAAAA